MSYWIDADCLLCGEHFEQLSCYGVICEGCKEASAKERGRREPDRRIIEFVMREFFPKQSIEDVFWDGLNGCWGFYIGTMFVGVEPDGYAHS